MTIWAKPKTKEYIADIKKVYPIDLILKFWFIITNKMVYIKVIFKNYNNTYFDVFFKYGFAKTYLFKIIFLKFDI